MTNEIKATDNQIRDFISGYWSEHGYAPSIREICRGLGYQSPSTMKVRLTRMREKGLVDYVDHTPRTLRVTKQEQGREALS